MVDKKSMKNESIITSILWPFEAKIDLHYFTPGTYINLENSTKSQVNL